MIHEKNIRTLSIICILFTITINNIQAASQAAGNKAPIIASACSGRLSSYPYISGDTFRQYANFIFDETERTFDPQKVKTGNVIFVKTDLLQEFFQQKHPLISCRYILLTHNSDYPIPGPYTSMLDDSKLIAWFGQNVENYTHPKLHPIPIGLANRYWAHGDVKVFDKAREVMHRASRNGLLYMNFEISTNCHERNPVYHMFKNKPFCRTSTPKALYYYLMDYAQYKFTLSPRGNGVDCHRTWEALYMNTIPIVKSSACDQLYDGLPVIIVTDWAEVTEEFLNKKYEEISKKSYNNLERIYADYWFKMIDEYKQQS